MVCDYAEDQPMFASHEIDPILDHNLSQIHGLAARWSLDPMSVRQAILLLNVAGVVNGIRFALDRFMSLPYWPSQVVHEC